MESKLQEDLNQIKTWSSQWRMKLSREKTEYCIFSRDKKDKEVINLKLGKPSAKIQQKPQNTGLDS
jgi:hypothetical protein